MSKEWRCNLFVDLKDSNCGPDFLSVDLTLHLPTSCTDEQARVMAAAHYGVPLSQVGPVRLLPKLDLDWAREVLKDPVRTSIEMSGMSDADLDRLREEFG